MSDTEHWPYEHAEPEKLAERIAFDLIPHDVFLTERAKATITFILAQEIHGLLQEVRSEQSEESVKSVDASSPSDGGNT